MTIGITDNDADKKKEGAENGVGGDAGLDASRRAKVRRCFIDPLTRDGLVAAKGVTVDDHRAFLDKLADRLGYLEEALLVTLAELTLGWAEGPARNRWPAFATIWNAATRLRQPPDNERHIMTTWLASIEGPRAREAGHLVELHSWLRKHGCPPSPYAMAKEILPEAAENARTRARVKREIDAGSARPSDVEWLNSYLRYLGYCEALVAGGEAHRAGKAAA